MAARVDPFLLHAEAYQAGRVPRLVTVAPARYLAVAGLGPPGGPPVEEVAVRLLEAARGLKARVRRELGKDFRLPPVEVLWRGDVPDDPAGPPGVPWRWKVLLRVPVFVRPADVAAARAGTGAPGPGIDLRLEGLQEGRCLQAVWTGAPSARAAALERLRHAAAAHALAFRGRLHEVWLSDPRRVPPERRRTLLRRPVRAR